MTRAFGITQERVIEAPMRFDRRLELRKPVLTHQFERGSVFQGGAAEERLACQGCVEGINCQNQHQGDSREPDS